MKELTVEELKSVQLQMMDYIDDFCRKNNIQYSIACGTLLGAVRHGGFIPWDDDIDIHLLRSEYNKFTTLWNSRKEEHPYTLINIESGNNMGYPFGKIHDPRTITYIGNIKRTGVFIDVFPIDFVTNENDFRKRHKQILELYKKRSSLFSWMQARHSNLFYKKLFSYLRKPKLTYNEIAVKISNIAQERTTRTDFVFEMVLGICSKGLVPTEVYEEFKDIKFEDRVYRCVSDTNTYLTQTYGDWETLPPLEKRVTHHTFSAFWCD